MFALGHSTSSEAHAKAAAWQTCLQAHGCSKRENSEDSDRARKAVSDPLLLANACAGDYGA